MTKRENESYVKWAKNLDMRGLSKSIKHHTERLSILEKLYSKKEAHCIGAAKSAAARRAKSNPKRLEARKLRRKKKTYQYIADELGVSTRTIQTWCKTVKKVS